MIAEGLILLLNRLTPKSRHLQEVDVASMKAAEYIRWEYRQAEREHSDWPSIDLKGKRVLDLGCGPGGKALFYAHQGPRLVVGLDIREAVLRATHQLGESQVSPRFIEADAARMPFAGNTFDVIISVNTVEHLPRPFETLKECQRVVQTGGHVMLRFPPYHSAWGAHLDRWIKLPWCHLLFSERALMNAVRRIEKSARVNERLVSFARIDLEHADRIPDLNRLTFSEFSSFLRQLALEITYLRLLPVGYDFFSNRKWLLSVLRFLTRVRLLQEVVTTKIVCVLQKPGRQGVSQII